MSNENVFKVPNIAEQTLRGQGQEGESLEAQMQERHESDRQMTYNFDTPKNSQEIYEELNAIAEEIEQCRLKNSLI